MMNVFPELLTYQLLAPALIRLGVAVVFLTLGYRHLFFQRSKTIATLLPKLGAWTVFSVWYVGIAELIVSILLLVGFLTQPAAIAGVVLAINLISWEKTLPEFTSFSKSFYFLFIVALLSLLFSGAGAFAFDMPL